MRSLLTPLVLFLFISCDSQEKKGPQRDKTTTEIPAKETNTGAGSSITGKWVLIEINVPGMKEEEKKLVLNKATIEFTTDGKYITIADHDKKETGTYDYNIKEKILTRHSFPGDSSEQFDVSWEKDDLKMTNKAGAITFRRVN